MSVIADIREGVKAILLVCQQGDLQSGKIARFN
jgi:hypothetical protein